MNDRERILMTLLDRLSLTQTLCLRGNKESMFTDYSGHEYVHFGAYDDRKIQPGDLVLCVTTNIHDWKIGWVDEVVSSDTCIIREIGSNRLCKVFNERFQRIVGMDKSLLLEGDEYLFEVKVKKAFRKGDEYWYRFGGVDYLENNVARIWIREAFGGMVNPSKPFSFEMKWNRRTSIKKILEVMQENGYGSRKFEPIKEIVKE